MIVKCEQCQTRFKIPDDKVTDKGVKVRCTKCSHTFRVTRDMAQAPAGPPAPAPAESNDPFARFGAPAAPSNIDVTRPGVFALGVEATRAPAPPPPAAAGFDFSSLSPPAPVPPTAPAQRPATVPPLRAGPPAMDFSAPQQPVAPPPRAPPPPPPAAAKTPAFDFSSLGVPPAPTAASQAFTQPAVPAFVPPVPPPAAPAGAGFDFSSLVPPAQPSAPGFSPPGGAAPDPAAAFGFQPQSQGYDAGPQPGGYDQGNASQPPSGYDFGGAAQQPGGYDYGSAAPQPGGYDFGNAAQQPGGYDYGSAAQQPGGYDYGSAAQQPGGYGQPGAYSPPSTDPYGAAPGQGGYAAPAPGGFDFAAVAPPASANPGAGFDFSALAPATGAEVASPPPPAYPGGPEASTQQVPSLAAPADPFANAPGASMSSNDARAMFDMPVPPPASAPEPSLLDVPPPEPEAAPRPASTSAAAPSAPKPAAAPVAEPQGARRNLVGIVVNVGIAAALVLGLVVFGSAFLNEGKISGDSLSWQNLKNTFAPSTPFVARDLSNGLYETQAGRAVFFVRGEVVNLTDAPVTLVVRAELVEGETVVRSAESWAGGPPTAEDLFLVDGTTALEALNKRVEQRAVAVGPGQSAPFVVPFTEYPPDLKDFRVRVSARPEQRPQTAANP